MRIKNLEENKSTISRTKLGIKRGENLRQVENPLKESKKNENIT